MEATTLLNTFEHIWGDNTGWRGQLERVMGIEPVLLLSAVDHAGS